MNTISKYNITIDEYHYLYYQKLPKNPDPYKPTKITKLNLHNYINHNQIYELSSNQKLHSEHSIPTESPAIHHTTDPAQPPQPKTQKPASSSNALFPWKTPKNRSKPQNPKAKYKLPNSHAVAASANLK